MPPSPQRRLTDSEIQWKDFDRRAAIVSQDLHPHPEPGAVSVLIVDDHPLLRAGLKTTLSQSGICCAIGEAGTGAEALQMLRESRWDVVLLDIAMPGMDGVDTLKEIRLINPDLPVLILSMYPEQQYAVNLMRAGAGGYLCKDRAPQCLIDAIAVLGRGQRYVSPELAERIADNLDRDSGEVPHASLSQREFQVFRKLAEGVAVSQIAAELELSVKTISTYRSRILDKMKMKTNADLTYYATKNGLLG